MAQANPFDQFDQTSAPGPVYGAPVARDPYKDAAEQRAARDQQLQEQKFALDQQKAAKDAAAVQGTLDPKTIEGQRNIATGILKNTGVNLQTGDDPVSELILNSTSGWLQTKAANVYGGVTGDATSGMEAIGKLKPMLADMTLQMTGGSLGSQISDGDRKFIMERMGNIADPEVPADQRLASWEEVKRRLAQMSGVEMPAMAAQGEEGLSGSVTDDSPAAPTGNNAPPSGGNGGGGSFWQGIGAGVGDIVEGATNNTVGLLINPINTVAGRAMGYEGFTSDIGQTLRDALQLPEGNQTVSAINQAAAGGLSAGGLARRGGQVLGSNALTAFGSTPLLDAATGATAAAAGEGARQAGAGPVGQAAASLGGGLLGQGGARFTNALARPKAPNPVMQAADDLSVTMMPADVGGTGTRLASGITRRTLGEIPMAEAAQNSLRTAANARDRVAGRIGSVTDETGAGQAAQRGAKNFVASSETRGGELYERISIPNKAEATADNTRNALGDLTRGLESNPELSKIWANNGRLRATLEALTPEDPAPRIKALQDAEAAVSQAQQRVQMLSGQAGLSGRGLPEFPDGGLPTARRELEVAQANLANAQANSAKPLREGRLSWEDLKRFRTIIGEISGSPSLTTDGAAKNALKKLYGALSQDMEATAASHSPQALKEFQRANQYWRGRENRIETVLSSILGNDLNKGEAAAFEQINRWAQQKGGDFKRLALAIRSMTPDEANTVRASLLGRMGTASKGRQNTDGSEFSPAEFMTQWSGLDNRAKAMLFPDADHRRDIDKLVTVMGGMKSAGQYANTSMTSLGVNAAASIGVGLSNPFLGVLMAGLQFGAGKLLASPDFARLVSKIPANPSPQMERKIIESISLLSAKDPTIRAEIIQLSDYLVSNRLRDSASNLTTAAAARDEEQNGGR